MKILILTSRFPYPPLSGDRIRIFHFIRELSRFHQVSLLSCTDKKILAPEINALAPYLTECELIFQSRLKSWINCIKGLFSKKPLQVHYYRSSHYKNKMQAMCLNTHYDVLLCHLLRTAEYAKYVQVDRKILDLTDALSLNYARLLKSKTGLLIAPKKWLQMFEHSRIRDYENKIAKQFDYTLLISDIDKNFLKRRIKYDSFKIVPAAVDTKYFTFSNYDYDPFNIIFTGKMNTVPNSDAILYFANKILPLIRKEIPQTMLSIVGIEPPTAVKLLSANNNIQVTGKVADIRTPLRNAAVSICPMRLGAGSKNKVIESMAIGTPVVSTSIGVEGLGLNSNDGVAIKDTAEEFAEEIISLLRDRKKREYQIKRARRTVEVRFTLEKAIEPLLEILKLE